MKRRPRHLSPEERALWDHVAHRFEPLSPERKTRAAEVASPTPKPKPALPAAPAPAEIPDFRVGERSEIRSAHDLLPGLGHRLRAAPPRMDAKTHARMARGKLKPEARLDLHGMTVAEAHPELQAFILGSQAIGRRLVLVITGKGKFRDDGGPIPVPKGILRHQVPQWLHLPPLAQAVLDVRPAHIRHGGEGAYYVYLRKR